MNTNQFAIQQIKKEQDILFNRLDSVIDMLESDKKILQRWAINYAEMNARREEGIRTSTMINSAQRLKIKMVIQELKNMLEIME